MKDALQCEHYLREVLNGLWGLAPVTQRAQWRMLPRAFPRWEAVYQQMQRMLRAACLEASGHDLRIICAWRLDAAANRPW